MLFAALKSTFAVAAAITSPVALKQDPAGTQTAPQQNPSYFNPQISMVGDFAGMLKDNGPGERRFDFREIELGFAADVDPFIRAEAYIAIAKEDGETIIEVEEAFGKYNNLGRGLSAKFGKIAAAVGRVQRNHADVLNYLDYPMVIRDVFGDEGLRQVGGSLSYLLPGNRFNEFTLEAIDAGDEGPVFNGSSAERLLYVGHYRTFFDFSEDLSAQLGASVLNGPTLATSDRGTTYGFDYTMKWNPGQKGKSAVLEAEAYWTKPGGTGSETAFGYFARGTYEFMPRWFLTLGVDSSEIPGTSDSHRSWLANVTLKPTEFHHWRLELENMRSNFEGNRQSLTIQFQWIIGAHPAHKY